MSSLFLLLSFVAIVMVALWSIEQERAAPEERGFAGLFGIKRPSTMPPPVEKSRNNSLRFGIRSPEPKPTAAPEKLGEEELAALFRKPPRAGE